MTYRDQAYRDHLDYGMHRPRAAALRGSASVCRLDSYRCSAGCFVDGVDKKTDPLALNSSRNEPSRGFYFFWLLAMKYPADTALRISRLKKEPSVFGNSIPVPFRACSVFVQSKLK